MDTVSRLVRNDSRVNGSSGEYGIIEFRIGDYPLWRVQVPFPPFPSVQDRGNGPFPQWKWPISQLKWAVSTVEMETGEMGHFHHFHGNWWKWGGNGLETALSLLRSHSPTVSGTGRRSQ